MHLCFRSKIDIRKLSAAVGRGLFMDFSLFRQPRAIFRILKSLSKTENVNGKIFRQLVTKMFWQCTVNLCKFDPLQIKQSLISNIINFGYELPHQLLGGLRLKSCFHYIFASFFLSLNESPFQIRKNAFLFHFKSSFCSQENQILEF